MPSNIYEGMFILDSNRYARDPAAAAQITKLIEKHGGSLKASRLWEERRLAYPIKGHRKGTYWLTYFEMETSHLSDLNRDCVLNESFLRHLFLKIDARIAPHMIDLAKGETRPKPPPKRRRRKRPQRARPRRNRPPRRPSSTRTRRPITMGEPVDCNLEKVR